jgi:50S ribosomal protein L16 3-hydroxylase
MSERGRPKREHRSAQRERSAASASAPRQLLGGRTVAAFLARYWQKRALPVRGAIPAIAAPVGREALFALAARDDIESRLVRRTRGHYVLEHGPFRSATLARLPSRNWTLLVQGVNLASDAADALLRRFAFIPYARLDDLMVSYAAPGGGVGPHYDSYDVFLLQAAGRRRWRYGRQRDLSLEPDMPLRILRHFAPTHDATFDPGDMLYLPPGYAHDGIAVDACVTCSIGFRAPLHQELAVAFVDHLRDTIDIPGRYADPDLHASRTPARLDPRMHRRVAQAMRRIRWDADDVARFLGRYLTEPRAGVVFASRPRSSATRFGRRIARLGVWLDRRTQLLYDDTRYYINGDDRPLPRSGSDSLRRLADARMLSGRECALLARGMIEILQDWHCHGYLADNP